MSTVIKWVTNPFHSPFGTCTKYIIYRSWSIGIKNLSEFNETRTKKMRFGEIFHLEGVPRSKNGFQGCKIDKNYRNLKIVVNRYQNSIEI